MRLLALPTMAMGGSHQGADNLEAHLAVTGNSRTALSFRGVLGLVIEYVIGPRRIADHIVGVIGRLVSGWPEGADTGRYGGDRPVDLGVAEKCERVALAASAVDRAVRRCEETVGGPAQQQLSAIDDKRVGYRWDVNPIAGLGAECQTRHVIGCEQGQETRIGMRRDAEFVVRRLRLRRVVGRAQLVLEVGKGPIEVCGGQVERAGINAHQALHQPLQRVAIFDERVAKARQGLGPRLAVRKRRPETTSGWSAARSRAIKNASLTLGLVTCATTEVRRVSPIIGR